MVSALIPLIGLMICGAVIALETKDLLSGIISLGIIGFALTIVFLILQAPDLAIVQIIIETLTLIILFKSKKSNFMGCRSCLCRSICFCKFKSFCRYLCFWFSCFENG